jgi:hypothetical protein
MRSALSGGVLMDPDLRQDDGGGMQAFFFVIPADAGIHTHSA